MSDFRDSILITGAGGMLGSYATFGMPTTRAELNITNLESIRSYFQEHQPKVVFHFAAATDLLKTQEDPLGTFCTNSMGAYYVALAAREVGAIPVLVSTSAVFDGTKAEPYVEGDAPNPTTEYGHAKYMAENAIAGVTDDHVIARTCWMFGGGPEKDHKFVANIIRQLGNEKIEVVGGKIGSPTYGKDFVEALVSFVEKGERGLVHIGNDGAPSRVEIAREIVRITGSKAEVIELPAEAFEEKYPGISKRGNESITSSRVTLRPWQEALAEYIETEWKGKIPS